MIVWFVWLVATDAMLYQGKYVINVNYFISFHFNSLYVVCLIATAFSKFLHT